MYDVHDHPDLREVDVRLQGRLDAVLEAEQQAAAIAARRSATLRDRLLEIEDGGVVAEVGTDAGRWQGRVTVGADHVAVESAAEVLLLPFDAIRLVRVP